MDVAAAAEASTSSISNYYGACLSLLSASVFLLASHFLRVTKLTVPPATKKNEYLAWKWRNFLISFIHSTISGVGVLYCFYEEPSLIHEMLTKFTSRAYLLVCISEGYFIYDIIEMMKHGYKGANEIIAHHLVILSCFSITVWQHKYLGYCCTALTIELHNIFLHLRQLMHIANIERESTIYKINRLVNIVTFIAFRMLTLIWIALCLAKHRALVPKKPYMIAVFAFMVIFTMTCILLYRLIKSDFCYRGKQWQSEEEEVNEKIDEHDDYDHGVNNKMNGTLRSPILEQLVEKNGVVDIKKRGK